MRISDWSSDVCSSDLRNRCPASAIMLLCGFCSTGARERMMRKTRDYDAELRALSDKAKSIKAKKIQPLGELVTGTGEIGRAHVCTPATNAHIVCRLLLEKTKKR